MVNGKSILLNTDYRVWLKFHHDITNGIESSIEPLLINKDIYLDDDEFEIFQEKIFEFLKNPNDTPHYEDGSDKKTYDYLLDGQYIYSAFMKVYHINLLNVSLHWHEFMALCDEISDDSTIWGHAKRARSYEKPSKNYSEEKFWQKEHDAWSFPIELSEEEQRLKDEFDDYFG